VLKDATLSPNELWKKTHQIGSYREYYSAHTITAVYMVCERPRKNIKNNTPSGMGLWRPKAKKKMKPTQGKARRDLLHKFTYECRRNHSQGEN